MVQPESHQTVQTGHLGGVKRSLSSFQEAQDQDKFSRNYEVMIQSPKPVKPVLHLPQLEANRFNQLQTRHWRPGDISMHSGSLSNGPEESDKFIPCTSPHRIRRILINPNLPYLELLAIQLQQLFFLQIRHDLSTLQTIKNVPRKLSYPLKPSRYKENTIYIHLPKILIIKPPTASFHGAINSFAFKLIKASFHRALWRPSSHLHPLIDLESDTHPARPVPSSFISHPLILVESDTHTATKISSPSIYPFLFEAMVGKTHGQSQMAKQNQQLTALQEINDRIAQLRKRNKARVQRPQQGERRFGDAPEAAKVSPILDKSVNESSTTCMSHLSLSKDDKTGPEVKKETISKSLLDLKSMLLKEAKPVIKVSHQGKFQTPPLDTSTDVCVLGTGRTNESYKLIVVPKKEPDPKLSHEPTSNDRGSVQGVYLYNQKEFQHETNFIGFYTPEAVQPNWNRAKVFTEQEVMNFTSQRFSSPSICEYPTLEGNSSPRKERPEPKLIIGVKRSLSSFQEAQDQDKFPRNYEVMIQSPKPVKPVLHLPQLEANRFNQLQTRHWRPGDISMHSGSLSNGPEESDKFIPCTSPHRIRRILINPNLPYLELLAIQLQQLFFLQIRHDLSTLQTIKKVPRKLSYPSNRPDTRRTPSTFIWPRFSS
ncbi:hypothetical protein IGI04_007402 [Brassica rapa subsp. trilocularis]|uniref:TPX2 central domain-containing protein n=1 Tax=Brassica rapa subsp. trilocularis TaxID=1813537 RepID=A0ABQ7NJL5_BRACM|nr:hypothetical protein IGI04_007402 [Brassica rapa subsp. trilocularis]